MKLLRKVNTICPGCLNKIEGSLLADDNSVSLHRDCGIDGVTKIVLSHNPEYYVDLDRFYFKVLKKGKARGRITNYWILSTHECQMRCSYCQINASHPFFQDMLGTDFDVILQRYRGVKLTLSGGEPTLNPGIFYFFKNALRLKRRTQLATNGLKIADDDFYLKLRDSGAKEIRISYESFTPIGIDSKIYEFNKFLDMKLLALKRLEKGDFSVSLSPTIFREANEGLLLETLDYAKDKLFVKEISVNGFSWSGAGEARDRNEMIMPDEMMDIICAGFNIKDRQSIFTLQKLLFLFLQLLNIRICMYMQIMIFVRKKGNLELIVDYLNMEKMKKALSAWERFSNAPYIIQLLTFFVVIGYSIKPRIFLLSKDILRMLLANIFEIDFSKYPVSLLPLVLNTNCSTLTADEEVGKQCMSGAICKRNDKVEETSTTRILLKIDC